LSKSANSSRLFQNNWLETCTHVHPAIPIIVWTPVIGYLIYLSLLELTVLQLLIWLPIGLFVWSLIEYSFHRFVFHFNAKSKLGKLLVFLLHGIHHQEPQDPSRLVMPPAASIIILALFYGGFYVIIGKNYIHPFFAFFLVGYLCYDYSHYATHHFRCKGRVMKFLKHNHMAHHHITSKKRYGVSSPLWDYVFGTFAIDKTN